MSTLQDILSKIFDQRGGTWVGVSTSAAVFMAITEFVTSGFRAGVSGWHPIAPAWFVAVPAGVYIAVLTLFVLNKGTSYYVDSRFNSPADQPPVKP